MIKFTNYNQETRNIDWTKHPAILHKTHKELMPLAQEGAYDGDADVKRVVDAYIAKLNAALSAQKEKPKVPVPVLPKKRAVTTTKPKKEQSKTVAVEHLNDEIVLIKRYVNFHNREKTPAQLVNLLKSIQKAILERRINKKSTYGNEVVEIQNALINALKHDAKIFDIKIEKSRLEKYTKIVTGFVPMTSIQLIKRYVGLQNKTGILDKVEKLSMKIQDWYISANSDFDKYHDYMVTVKANLKEYVHQVKVLKNKNATLKPFADAELNGLGFLPTIIAATAGACVQAIAHHQLNKKKNNLSGAEPGVMSVADAKNETFKEIGFTGKLRELIGDACTPTSLFIYGNGGSGKSSLSLCIADDLNKKGKSILYIAGEQYGTPTFKKLLDVTKITGGENFKIVKSLNTLPINDFDVIVIDSKESINLEKSADFKALRDMYPDKNYIITSQGTKDGNFRGDEKWRNEVDTMIFCENGRATTLENKNRWGARAEIKLF